MVTGVSTRRVLEVLSNNPNISQSTIQELTNLSNRTVRYSLEELKFKKLIREVIDLTDSRKRQYEAIL